MNPEEGNEQNGLTGFNKLDELVRNDVKEQRNDVQARNITSDITKDEFGDFGVINSAVTNASELRNQRAANQGFFATIGSGVAQTVLAAPGRILASTGDMLDIPDYVNGTPLDDMLGDGPDEYGNFFSDWIRESVFVKGVEDTFKIHKYEGSELMSPTKPGWWKEVAGALTDLAGSATEFAGAGMGIGKLISKGLRTAGMATKLSKTVAGQGIVDKSERLMTAVAMNQAESLGMAADLNHSVYNDYIDRGFTASESQRKANIAAATSMNMNRMNIALNLSSVGAFGMGGFGTRMMNEAREQVTTKGLLGEGVQEFAEEVINFTGEQSGLRAAERGEEIGLFDSFVSSQAWSDRINSVEENPMDALESGILGFIGGVAQTKLTNTMNDNEYLAGMRDSNIPGADKLRSIVTVGGRLGGGVEVTKVDENGFAIEQERGEDGEFVGFETEKVTKNEAHRRRYDLQQKLKGQYDEAFGKKGSKAMWDFQKDIGTHKEIVEAMALAKKNGDVEKYNQLNATMLQHRAYQAFETGTTGVLLEAMGMEVHRSSDMTKKELSEAGLPPDYTQNLREGQQFVREMEKEYLKSKGYQNSEYIYHTSVNQNRSKLMRQQAQRELDRRKGDLTSAVQDELSGLNRDDFSYTDTMVGNMPSQSESESPDSAKRNLLDEFSADEIADMLIGNSKVDGSEIGSEKFKAREALLGQLANMEPELVSEIIKRQDYVATARKDELTYREIKNYLKSNKGQMEARTKKAKDEAKQKASDKKAQLKAKNDKKAKKAASRKEKNTKKREKKETQEELGKTEVEEESKAKPKAKPKSNTKKKSTVVKKRPKTKEEANKEASAGQKGKTREEAIDDFYATGDVVDPIFKSIRDQIGDSIITNAERRKAVAYTSALIQQGHPHKKVIKMLHEKFDFLDIKYKETTIDRINAKYDLEAEKETTTTDNELGEEEEGRGTAVSNEKTVPKKTTRKNKTRRQKEKNKQKPPTKEKEPTTNKEGETILEDDTIAKRKKIQETINRIGELLGKRNQQQAPGDNINKNRINTDDTVELIELVNTMLELYFNGVEPAFKSFVEVMQDGEEGITGLGELFTIDNFVALKQIFGLATNQTVEGSYKTVMTMSDEEARDWDDSKDLFESVIENDHYTEDTHSRQTDEGEGQANDSTTHTNARKKDRGLSARGGKSNDGSSQVAYLASTKNPETIEDLKQVEADVKENMKEPALMSADRFPAGTPIVIEKHPNPDGVIVFNKFTGTDTTYAQLVVDAKKRIKNKNELSEFLLSELPMIIKATGEGNNTGVIGDLHAGSWINSGNVREDIKTLEDQRAELMALRQHVAKNGSFTSEITEKTYGKLLYLEKQTTEGGINTESAAEMLPDTNLELAVASTNGLMFGDKESSNNSKVNEDNLASDKSRMAASGTYVMLPVPGADGTIAYIATPLYNNKVSESSAKSMSKAINIFFNNKDGEFDSLVDELSALGGDNVSTFVGLKGFLRQYAYDVSPEILARHEGSSNLKKLQDYANSKSDGKVFMFFDEDNKIHMVRGGGYALSSDYNNDTSPSVITFSNSPKNLANLQENLAILEDMVTNFMYSKVESEKLNSEGYGVFGFNENGVVDHVDGNYNEWVKQNSRSGVGSINIGTAENPNYVYSTQPVVNFNSDLENADELKAAKNTKQPETAAELEAAKNRIESNLTKAQEERLKELKHKISNNIGTDQQLQLDVIEFTFLALGQNINAGVQIKVNEYVDRITSGQESYARATQGLSPSFISAIDAALKANSKSKSKNTNSAKAINDAVSLAVQSKEGGFKKSNDLIRAVVAELGDLGFVIDSFAINADGMLLLYNADDVEFEFEINAATGLISKFAFAEEQAAADILNKHFLPKANKSSKQGDTKEEVAIPQEVLNKVEEIKENRKHITIKSMPYDPVFVIGDFFNRLKPESQEEIAEAIEIALQVLGYEVDLVSIDGSGNIIIVSEREDGTVTEINLGKVTYKGGVNGPTFGKVNGKHVTTDSIRKQLKEIEGEIMEQRTWYQDSRDGANYERVSTVINNEVLKDNRGNKGLLATSQQLGTEIDEFIRAFFDGTLQPISTYPFASDVEITKLLQQLEQLKQEFDARGEVVVSQDVVLFDDANKVAGTVDLLTYDADGNFRIYDIKTMRGDQLKDKYGKEKKSKYESTKFNNKNKRRQHQEQLSLYRILLNNTHSIKAVELAVIPIVIQYNEGVLDATFESEKKDNIPVDPLDRVEHVKIRETVYQEALREEGEINELWDALTFAMKGRAEGNEIPTANEIMSLLGKQGHTGKEARAIFKLLIDRKIIEGTVRKVTAFYPKGAADISNVIVPTRLITEEDRKSNKLTREESVPYARQMFGNYLTEEQYAELEDIAKSIEEVRNNAFITQEKEDELISDLKLRFAEFQDIGNRMLAADDARIAAEKEASEDAEGEVDGEEGEMSLEELLALAGMDASDVEIGNIDKTFHKEDHGGSVQKAPKPLNKEAQQKIKEESSSLIAAGLSAREQQEIVDYIAAMESNAMFEGLKDYDFNSAFDNFIVAQKEKLANSRKQLNVLNKIINANKQKPSANILKTLDNLRLQIAALEGIQNNRNHLKNLIIRKLQKTKGISVTFGAEQDTTDKQDGSSSYEKDQMDTTASFTTDAKQTVGANVRKFLSGIKDSKYNPKTKQRESLETWFGESKIVDFDEMFNTISAILSDMEPDLDQMIARLEQYKERYGYLPDLIAKLKAAAENPEVSVDNEFVVAMAKHEVKMKYVWWFQETNAKTGKVTYTSKVLDSNESALAKGILSNWYDNLLRNSPLLVTEEDGSKFLDKAKAGEALDGLNDIINLETEADISYAKVLEISKELKQIGDKVTKSIPPKNGLHKIADSKFPITVSKRRASRKVTKNIDGTFTFEKIDQAASDAVKAKKEMADAWLRKNFKIELSKETWQLLATEGMKIRGSKDKVTLNNFFSPGVKNSPLNVLKTFLEKEVKKTSEATDFTADDSVMNNESIRALAAFQAKNERHIFSNSFQTGKKSVYTYTKNKYATDRMRSMKNDPQLIADLNDMAFNGKSLWLNDFSEDGNNEDHYMEVGYASLQAIKQRGAKNTDDKALTEISESDHEYYKLALFADMEGGKVGNARKVTFLYPTVPATKGARLVVKNKEVVVNFDQNRETVDKSVIEMFYNNVFMAEGKRINEHQNDNQNVNDKAYDEGANFFHFLPMLNSMPELFNPDTGKLLDVSNLSPEVQGDIYGAISAMITLKAEEKVEEWREFGFVQQATDKAGNPRVDKNNAPIEELKYVDSRYIASMGEKGGPEGMSPVLKAAFDFEVNQMIGNVNMFQTLIGDPALFWKEKAASELGRAELLDHYAAIEFIENYTKETITIDDYNTMREEYESQEKKDEKHPLYQWENTSKEIKDATKATVKDLVSKDNMSKQVMLTKLGQIDNAYSVQVANEMITEVFNNVGKRLSADIAPGEDIPMSSQRPPIKYLFLADKETKSINNSYIKKLKLKGGASYSEIEGADAQEYTTWQEHLALLKDMGKVSPREYKKLYDLLAAGKDLNKGQLNTVLQPVKPVYTGNVTENYGNARERRVYIKTSSFPLIPQLTNGLDIDKVRKIMEGDFGKKDKDGNVITTTAFDRAPFKTGAKLGSPAKLLQLYNDDMSIRDDITPQELQDAALQLTRDNFRIQLEVPYKESKNKVNIGSQERKLLFTNIRDMEGFMFDGESTSAKKLEARYNQIYGELFKSNYDKLKKRLIDQDGNVLKKELFKILEEEAIGRGYPLADLMGIATKKDPITGETDFVMPLWANPSHKQFEQLLISVVRNSILKMKFNGGSFVMGSEEGFRTLKKPNQTNEEYHEDVKSFIKKYNEKAKASGKGGIAWTKQWQGELYPQGEYWVDEANNDRRYTLEQYDSLTTEQKLKLVKKVMPGQVLLPSKIRDRRGRLIDMTKFVDPKTGTVSERTLPKELRELFHFRIPTQGHNSMSWAEVAGFLPPEVGDLMIGSRDLTVQKGLDFDVDKEFAYFYNMREVYNDRDPEVLRLKVAYEQALITTGWKDKLAEKKALEKEFKANGGYRTKDLKGEELSPLVVASLEKHSNSKELLAIFDAMTLEQINELNQQRYEKARAGDKLPPVKTMYSGKEADNMVLIKESFNEANKKYSEEVRQPMQKLKELKTELRNAENDTLRDIKNELKAAQTAATRFAKLGAKDSEVVLFVDGNSTDPETGEPVKIRVVVNDEGDIVNDQELEDNLMLMELDDKHGGDFAEWFKTNSMQIVKEKKLLNEILDIHKSILMHPDVQPAVLEPLAFGDLKGDPSKGNANISKEIFDAKNKLAAKQNKKGNSFTPMGSTFQRDKLTSGQAGGIGIGAFSLDSVFLSQAQGKAIIINEQITIDDNGNGNATSEWTPISIKFGDNFTEVPGDISEVYVNQRGKNSKNPHTRFDVIAAFQSAAVDNENEQILDKINSNKFTFDATRTLAFFGFDEKLISAFISQPAIVEFAKKQGLGETELGFNNSDAMTLIEAYEEQYDVPPGHVSSHRGYNSEIDSAVGFNELMEMIKKSPDEYGENFHKYQAQLLRKFVWLTTIGKTKLKAMQDVLKVDSSGVGSNFMDISDKYAKFEKMLKRKNEIKGLGRLIGDIVDRPSTEAEERLLEEDGYKLLGSGNEGGIMIRPTTIAGFALTYALDSANTMFEGVIPYNDVKDSIIRNAQIMFSKDIAAPSSFGTSALIEMFDDLKSYLISRDKSRIIGSTAWETVYKSDKIKNVQRNSIFKTRNALLVDKVVGKKVVNQSLGTVLNELKKDAYIANNQFLSRLTTKTQSGVNFINYNASVDRGFDDTAVYAGFAELFSVNKFLGTFNGRDYTTSMLGQDLVAYAMATGGVQGAQNFIRYIPVPYLIEMGYGGDMKDAMNSMLGKSNDGNMQSFLRQWAQNNPDKVHSKTGSYIWKGTAGKQPKDWGGLVTVSYTKVKFPDDKKRGHFITVKNSSNPSGYDLYEWNAKKKDYLLRPTAGMAQMKEYDGTNTDKRGSKTVVKKYKGKKVKGFYNMKDVSPDTSLMDKFKIDGEDANADIHKRHQHYLGAIIQDDSVSSGFKALADSMLAQNDALLDIQVNTNNDLDALGVHYRTGLGSQLEINESQLQGISKNKRAGIILHEYVHAFTVRAMKAPRDKMSDKMKAAVDSVEELRQAFIERIGEDRYQMMKDAYAKNAMPLSVTNLEYGALNEYEFIAVAMTSPAMQEELSKMEWKSNKSFLEKLFDVISGVLKSMGFENAQDTALEQIVGDFMTIAGYDPATKITDYGSAQAVLEEIKIKTGAKKKPAPVLSSPPELKAESGKLENDKGGAAVDGSNGNVVEDVPKKKGKKKGKRTVKGASRDTGGIENSDRDPDYFPLELKEGANKTLRKNQVKDIADKLKNDGRLKFKCK